MQTNIIGCDVGLKRIGLAQIIQGIILPLPPIIRKNRNQAAKELQILLSQKQAKILVVGIPSGGEAKYDDTQKRIKHFISLLAFDGEIVYINEDYTSQEALHDLAYMRQKAKRLAQKNGSLDSIAACKILEIYSQSL